MKYIRLLLLMEFSNSMMAGSVVGAKMAALEADLASGLSHSGKKQSKVTHKYILHACMQVSLSRIRSHTHTMALYLSTQTTILVYIGHLCTYIPKKNAGIFAICLVDTGTLEPSARITRLATSLSLSSVLSHFINLRTWMAP